MPAVAASQKLTGEVTAPKNTTTKSSSSSLYTFPRFGSCWFGSDEECKASQSAAVPAFLSNSKWFVFVRRLEKRINGNRLRPFI
jgi:hypothetical protein